MYKDFHTGFCPGGDVEDGYYVSNEDGAGGGWEVVEGGYGVIGGTTGCASCIIGCIVTIAIGIVVVIIIVAGNVGVTVGSLGIHGIFRYRRVGRSSYGPLVME